MCRYSGDGLFGARCVGAVLSVVVLIGGEMAFLVISSFFQQPLMFCSHFAKGGYRPIADSRASGITA